ncbi:peptidylprolyl isomerase [Microbispora sp. NBRC 16548]|uniref:peptidylprolyl isomerase n=1 Tax=Microbispora sp. NBRC 16548 TaxID=3030994 RepID=UPI0024A5F3E3|nr:peptidylprolyl isomerase [Microbispora sp. NBRC 16548]GLX09108.1 peptidylprolyl isomerase [Microbispora sp. NBRC 16548]
MTDTDRQKQPASHVSTAGRATTPRRRLRGTLGAGLGLLVLAGSLAACSDGSAGNTAKATPSASPSASDSEGPTVQHTELAGPTPTARPTDLRQVTCQYRKDDTGAPSKNVGFPPSKLTRRVILAKQMIITTNQGEIVIDLATKDVPCAVNSLAFLASKNFYDNTVCHRLATVETVGLGMLQCGDPLATGNGKRKEDGAGGPGYLFDDENLGGMPLVRGTVGLAQATEDANSNGSQFFISFTDENSQLTAAGAAFTMIGVVSKGMNVIDKIAKGGIIPFNGDPTADVRGEGSNAPKKKVVIKDVAIV